MSATSLTFELAYLVKKIDFDYTPNWGRGTPSSYIDNLTFPKVLTDKKYAYRVLVNSADLGVESNFAVAPSGAQTINFLQYNKGYGIADTKTIQVFVVIPDTGNSEEYIIAEWKKT